MYNLFLDIDYDVFFLGGGGVMGLGNKAVKVKESDCEKMVSANLPFLLTLTRLLMRFGKIVHFFTIAQRSTKEIMAQLPLNFQ